VTPASDKPIQHVSDTAHWIAHYRALESARPDALFHDPLASALAQARGTDISSRMGFNKPLAWSVSIRTYLIDQYIQNAITEGVDTVVNLGAGLDTRPYRLNVPPQLKWIEVDFPQVMDFKEHHLQNEKPRCELKRVRLDLSDVSKRAHLLSEINAASKKVLVITEGVVIYLTNEDVESLGKALASQSNFRLWITDYFSPFFMDLYRQGRLGTIREKNVRFHFFPENWEAFFKNCGWSLKEMRYLTQESRKLGRRVPTPLLRRLLIAFLPKEKKEAIRKMTGYAMLSR
jgi:methyltransferase (TIGR00027 family)